jgi:flavin reductase (DIM6/NTAB) family NADH-FMN oxidoreductase RutF
VLKKGQLELAAHYGRPAGPDKLALMEWTTGRIGAPLLLESLAWFECQVVGEHPAGDHVLVLGKVIDGNYLLLTLWGDRGIRGGRLAPQKTGLPCVSR